MWKIYSLRYCITLIPNKVCCQTLTNNISNSNSKHPNKSCRYRFDACGFNRIKLVCWNQTCAQAERQTDRQTDRQTETKTERQTQRGEGEGGLLPLISSGGGGEGKEVSNFQAAVATQKHLATCRLGTIPDLIIVG